MKKYIKLCALFLVVICVFSACGKTPKQEIAGYWQKTDGTGFDHLEFFEDGKYTSDRTNYEGNFSLSDNRIRLEGILVDSKSYTYSISGDTLTFYNNSGDVYATYERTK